MTNIWHDISPSRINPEDFIAVIEIEKGSKKKYELDKETGHIILDRILYTSTHYPANYGLIPRTFADDGDPLDVLVLCSEVLAPLSLVRCYPIGVITMQEVVDRLHEEYGWSDSVSNLSAKLQRESIRYKEVVELADVLGYDLIWQKRR